MFGWQHFAMLPGFVAVGLAAALTALWLLGVGVTALWGGFRGRCSKPNQSRRQQKEWKLEMDVYARWVAKAEEVQRSGAELEELELKLEELQELRERRRREEGKAAAPASPECPVCLNSMAPPAHIFQCGTGHKVCGTCRPKLKECPVK
jgi:hypothetical protein